MKINIKKKRGSWNFGKNVPNKFVNHITASVPEYDLGHEIILKLSDFFLKDNSNFYDIGCSTGNLIEKLYKFSNKKVNLIGLDSEKQMISFARKNLKKKKIRNFKIVHSNILKQNLKKSDLIVSYYTIQFIPPKYRQNVINKIYKSLNWGGAFIMFEKVRAPDARFQDILNSLYLDFKEENGFSNQEIIEKQKSLRGVLEPFSTFGNTGLLKRSGFVDITTIFKHICFEGYLCIK